MEKPTPLILAAGKGERLGFTTIPKPMASIDKMRPIIGSIVSELLGMNYRAQDIGIVVGHKKEAIIDYLGYGYRYIVQKNLGSPINGVIDYTEENCDNNLLVIHADDSGWLKKDTLEKLMKVYNQQQKNTMLFVNSYDSAAHNIGYLLVKNRIVEAKKILNDSKELAYSAGAFCIKKTFIENYDLNTKKEVGISTLFANTYSEQNLYGLTVDIPWKSTNTMDGLFEARHLYEKTFT